MDASDGAGVAVRGRGVPCSEGLGASPRASISCAVLPCAYSCSRYCTRRAADRDVLAFVFTTLWTFRVRSQKSQLVSAASRSRPLRDRMRGPSEVSASSPQCRQSGLALFPMRGTGTLNIHVPTTPGSGGKTPPRTPESTNWRCPAGGGGSIDSEFHHSTLAAKPQGGRCGPPARRRGPCGRLRSSGESARAAYSLEMTASGSSGAWDQTGAP